MKLNLFAATISICLIFIARAVPVSIAASAVSTAQSGRDEQLSSRGDADMLEKVVSGVLHSSDDAVRLDQATAAPGQSASAVESLAASSYASNAATELAMYKESLKAGQGTSSGKTGISKRQQKRLRYLEQKAAAAARGTTVYYERLKRLTEAGKFEAYKATRDGLPRNVSREYELRVQKHIREGGTRESFKDAEYTRWRKGCDKRRQKKEAAREAAESLRLQQHLHAGGTRESFKPAKPMQTRPRKRKSSVANDGESRADAKAKSDAHLPEVAPESTSEAAGSMGPRSILPIPSAQPTSALTLSHVMPPSRFPFSLSPVDDVVLPLYSAAHRQGTGHPSAVLHAALPPAAREVQTQHYQAHPLASQERLPAVPSQPPLLSSSSPTATLERPTKVESWVDSLFVESPP